jgi:hypothetical protein
MTAYPTEFSEPYAVVVEAGKLAEIARAARGADPAPQVAPPAFFYGAAYLFGSTWERPGNTPLALAPIDPAQLLHAEEEVEFPGPPPRAGSTLSARVRLESVVDKPRRSGDGVLRFVRATTEYRDPAGDVVAIARTTAVQELHG